MYGELDTDHESGRRFVALAEEHAEDFATRAASTTARELPAREYRGDGGERLHGGAGPEEFGGSGCPIA